MKVFTCRHTLWRDGRNAGMFDSDMVFIDGNPHLVFSWIGDCPELIARLDPAHLSPLDWPTVQYLYGQTVDYPGPPTH